MISSFLLFILLNLNICDGYIEICNEEQCQSKIIKCTENENCEIKCVGDSSCEKATIQCPKNNECIVECADDYACFSATIDAKYSSKLELKNCAIGEKTCVGISIYCPVDDKRESCVLPGISI